MVTSQKDFFFLEMEIIADLSQ